MSKFISKEILSKDRRKMVIASVIIVVISLFLTNTYSMFWDIEPGRDRAELIKMYFSLSPINVCILYFIFGAFIITLFTNKNELIKGVHNGDYDFRKLFFTKYLTLIFVVVLTTVTTLIFKIMAYLVNRHTFLEYSIGIGQVFIGFFIMTSVFIATASLGFLCIFLVKNNFIALSIIPITAYCIFLFFGALTFFLSKELYPVVFVLEKISSIILDPIIIAMSTGWRIELQGAIAQVLFVAFYIVLDVFLVWISYKAMIRISEEILEREQYFLWIEKGGIVVLSFMGAFAFMALMDLIVLLTMPKVFNKVSLVIDILAILLGLVLYKIQSPKKKTKAKLEENLQEGI